MKEKTGDVFSVADDNPPIYGCTVSKEVSDGVFYYSLAENTDISAEIYPYGKLMLVCRGDVCVYGEETRAVLNAGEIIITPTLTPVGVRTDGGAVYTEIIMRRNDKMNKMINAGEVFKLSELVPYQDGKIVNMDVVHGDKMKFVVMAFDKGTALSEHAAPGEALIFALDGCGIIGYEGKEYRIEAGENFHFAKGGLHYVKAEERFKMALLLTL